MRPLASSPHSRRRHSWRTAPRTLSPAPASQPWTLAPPASLPTGGGAYVTITATLSECHYIVSGAFYYDNYDNGVYTGTLVYRDGAKMPTERPQMPDTFTMPGGVPLLIPFAG
ncbi:hypothetical protein ACORG1_28600 [Mycobacterium sp. TJFP1]